MLIVTKIEKSPKLIYRFLYLKSIKLKINRSSTTKHNDSLARRKDCTFI